VLAAAAGLDRGAAATPAERAAVERAVVALEAASSPEDGWPPPLSRAAGRWRLAYASVEPFRSSPFFWGFAQGVCVCVCVRVFVRV
jgi:hypothetical protein